MATPVRSEEHNNLVRAEKVNLFLCPNTTVCRIGGKAPPVCLQKADPQNTKVNVKLSLYLMKHYDT
jgi:hypothetical protein